MKKVNLSKEQIRKAEQQGAMVAFDMTLPPDKLKEQIAQFLRDNLVDEDAISDMADDLMAQFYHAMAQETNEVN